MSFRLQKLEAFDRMLPWLNRVHPTWLAAPLASSLLALGDVSSARGPITVRVLLAAACAGLLGGALVGVGLTLVFEGSRRAPLAVRLLTWPILGGLLAFWLCEALAVRTNLGGPYDTLARSVIKGSLVMGAAASVVGAFVQPSPKRPNGWFGHLHPIVRILVCAVSALALAALTWVDRSGYVVEYPSATRLLRWSALSAGLLVMLGLLQWCSARAPAVTGKLVRFAPPSIFAVALVSVPLIGKAEASRLMERPFSASAVEVLRVVTDLDGDGYSSLFGGGDCKAFNARVSPAQREKPHNGVDDNCLGGDYQPERSGKDMARHALQPAPAIPTQEPNTDVESHRPMSVVYITVDTVGAESLRPYGYHRDTTPRLTAWAKRAVVFDSAYTCGTATAVAFGGTFRGVYPRRVLWNPLIRERSGRMRLDTGGDVVKTGERRYRLPLGDPRDTLGELATAAGVRTFAVSPVHFVKRDTGVVGRFDQQKALMGRGSRVPNDKGATSQALKWLGKLEPDDRYFMWVHYLGPHTPSTKTKGVRKFGKSERDLYDHEIATFDKRVGPLLAELSARQERGEDLVVIVSADHGEEFLAHRFHGHDASDRVAHIPLFVSMPGVSGSRTSAVASSVDIFPTVLSLLGVPVPSDVDGRDLTPVIKGEVKDWSRVVFTDGWVNDAMDRLQSNQVVATDGKLRLRVDLTDMAEELIDLAREREGARGANLVGARDDRHLRAALTSYLERAAIDPRAP